LIRGRSDGRVMLWVVPQEPRRRLKPTREEVEGTKTAGWWSDVSSFKTVIGGKKSYEIRLSRFANRVVVTTADPAHVRVESRWDEEEEENPTATLRKDLGLEKRIPKK